MAIEWEHRELCPDGACVGVIGPEGTCRVCGRAAPNWGEERTRGLLVDASSEDEADDHESGDDRDAEVGHDASDPIDPSAPAAIGRPAWQDRRLCPDGACIGLVGDDGRCKVCRRRGSAPRPGAEPDGDAGDDEPEKDAAKDERADDEDVLASAAAQLAESAPSDEVADLTPAPALAPADEIEDRKLCPDGACVGVIGPDGTCKVCGAEAA